MEYRPGSSRKQGGLPLRKEDEKQNRDPIGSHRLYAGRCIYLWDNFAVTYRLFKGKIG